MNKSDVKIGVRVVYARGSKGPLIGHKGIIDYEFIPNEYGLLMVKFDDGNSYPCDCEYEVVESLELKQ